MTEAQANQIMAILRSRFSRFARYAKCGVDLNDVMQEVILHFLETEVPGDDQIARQSLYHFHRIAHNMARRSGIHVSRAEEVFATFPEATDPRTFMELVAEREALAMAREMDADLRLIVDAVFLTPSPVSGGKEARGRHGMQGRPSKEFGTAIPVAVIEELTGLTRPRIIEAIRRWRSRLAETNLKRISHAA